MNRMKSVFLIVAAISITIVAMMVVSLVTKKTTQQYTIKTSEKTVVKQLRELNRLETASFTIEKIIDASTSGNKFEQFLYGDRILLIAQGEVIAGFNFAALQEKAVQVDGTTVVLTLPAPTILVTKLDNDQTRVYDRKLGLLTKGDNNLEAKARQEAEKAITEAACKGNILSEASKNARNQLTALLKALGFQTITITIPEASC